MQDVFEPMNFSGEVFEPTANFSGEVFEPMNFVGRKNKKIITKPVKPVSEPKKVVEKITEKVVEPVIEIKPITTEVISKQTGNSNSGKESNKFLGMPRKVGIGVTIGAVAIAGFFLYKKFGAKILKKITKK
jgi:hypothetical protein